MRNPEFLLQALQRIHDAIRDAVVVACEATALEQMATVTAFEGGDTIYAIDRVSEAVLLTQFADLAQHYNFRLVAELPVTTASTIFRAVWSNLPSSW
jgi:hypothetical protein